MGEEDVKAEVGRLLEDLVRELEFWETREQAQAANLLATWSSPPIAR